MKTEPVGGCRIVRLVKCYCLDDANVLVSSDCDEMVFTGRASGSHISLDLIEYFSSTIRYLMRTYAS